MDPDIDLSHRRIGIRYVVTVGNIPNAERKRGVKRGTRRGQHKPTGDERARVLAAYDGAGDWRAVAEANGVRASTAHICVDPEI